VTLGRIAACFPEIIARIYKKGKINNKFGYSGDLANYLMFPQAPSIMDKEEDYNKWKEWNEKFTKVINPPKKKKSKKKGEEEEEEYEPTDYGLIIYQSKLFSESDRRRIMDKLRSDETVKKVNTKTDKADLKAEEKGTNVVAEKKAVDLKEPINEKDPRFFAPEGESYQDAEVRIMGLSADLKASTDDKFFEDMLDLVARKSGDSNEVIKAKEESYRLSRKTLLRDHVGLFDFMAVTQLSDQTINLNEAEAEKATKEFIAALPKNVAI